MSVPGSRDAPRRETDQRSEPLNFLHRKSMKIWVVNGFSIVFSPPGHSSAMKITAMLVMQLLVRLMPAIAASAVNPCQITTIYIFSVFGTTV